jgi:hypothetical protein
MKNTECVVTLVHGTFAQNAAWCLPTSSLRTALASEFGNDCTVSMFQWSGNNAHSSRLEAGDRLHDHLVNLVEQYPGATQFIIAHSHGGNVTAYALRSETLQKRIHGIVFLATPHLYCSPRDIHKTLSLLSLFLLPISVVLAVIIPSLLVGIPVGAVAYNYESNYERIPEALGWVAIFTCLCTTGILIWLINKRVGAWAEPRLETKLWHRIDATIERYSPPFLATRILNVSTPLDEAGVYLRLLRFIAGIPFFLWRPGLLLFLCGGAQILLLLGLLFSVLSGSMFEGPAWTSDPNPVMSMLGFSAGLVFVLAFPVIVFALSSLLVHTLMLLVPKMVRGNFYGYGGETIVDNLLIDIHVDNTPFAAEVEDVRRLVPRVGLTKRIRWLPRFRFGHCAVYDDEFLIKKIVSWIAITRNLGPLKSKQSATIRSAANPLGLQR